MTVGPAAVPRATGRPFGGFLVLVKPPGMTSHDAVRFVRRKFGTRDVGHAGTLDPAAAGVLVAAVGKGLKLLEFLGDADKEYCGEFVFGRSTTTGDAEGDTVEEGDPSRLTSEVLRRAMAVLTGPISQVPPAFSAIKVGGRPVYEKARRGETVALPPRLVTVHRFDLLDWWLDADAALGRARFRVRCSKGTYVRVLAEDLGRATGVPAHLGFLLRTVAGPFGLEQAVTLEEVEAAAADGTGRLVSLLQPLVAAIPKWPRARLTPAGMNEVRHGRPVALGLGSEPAQLVWEAGDAGGGPVALLDPEGGLAAVGRLDVRTGLVRPVKLVAPSASGPA